MRALLRKELWQVLPAHFLVAVLFTAAWFVVADPREVLAPFDSNEATLHLVLGLVFVLEGTLLGFAQFGMERWGRTEAYLVHRATGKLAAFTAKVLAGLAALAVVIVLPPLIYGAWYLGVDPNVVGGQPARLLFAVAASSTGLVGYALGVFAAQLRRGWLARALFAGLGALLLPLSTMLGVVTLDRIAHLGPAPTLLIRLALVQLVLVSGVLAVAYSMFREGEDMGRPWRPVTAMAGALLAVGLYLLPLGLIPTAIGIQARQDLLASYPHVVADESGALFLATPWEPGRVPEGTDPRGIFRPYQQCFDLVDAAGVPVPEAQALRYDGGSAHSTYVTIFRPGSTPLQQVARPDAGASELESHAQFAFDGPWVALPRSASSRSLDLSSGDLWFAGDSGFERREWTRITGLPASVVVIDPLGWGGGRRPLFVDPGLGRLWTVDDYGFHARARLVELSLPGGDRYVGLEPLSDLESARSGLYSRYHAGDSGLIEGEQGLYAWLDTGELVAWSDVPADRRQHVIPQREVARTAAWRLVPRDSDGLGFRLEVQDARTGVVGLVHDFRPGDSRQERAALRARAASLAAMPLGSLVSWLSAPADARDVLRSSQGWFDDPLLVGHQHTWILVVVLVLTALMALSTWRRLSAGGAPLGPRVLWCGAVCAFGWSAFLLCRLLEPRPRRARVETVAREAAQPALVIRTA